MATVRPTPRPSRRTVAAVLLALVLTATLAACGSSGGSGVPAASGDQCAPRGVNSASAAPTNLDASGVAAAEARYTTADAPPVSSIDVTRLNLITPGVLSVGTLSDAPPSICIDSTGKFTGFDNELLGAVAAKLGLRVQFSGTEFSGLLAQVAGKRFDVGSSSITSTDARRQLVGFTNGYDFGYFALVAKTGGPITRFEDLTPGTRIGVVQGTVQDDYVVNTLKLQPVKFPDYNTAYANLKTGQIDAWVAPSQQANGLIAPADGTSIVQNTFSLNNFVGWAVAKDNQPLIDALNAGLDAIIADGTWARLYSDWVPREVPAGFKPGSRAAAQPQLPDFAAIAAKNSATAPAATATAPKSTLAQLKDTFFDWSLYTKAFPDLLRTGLPNTLILALASGVLGTALGMVLALAGLSRSRWLRWPARVYTDIFRGLPAVVIILVIGLGVGPVVKDLTGGNPYWLGVGALSLLAAAYIGEIFRSGIQSVESGQLEASRALGFSYRSSMRLVVVPQGVRRVLPALMNQFIALIKDSSLIYFLGLLATQRELFAVGRDLNAQTGNLSPLVAAGLFYLALTVPLTHLVNYIDSRLRTGRTPDPVELPVVAERS